MTKHDEGMSQEIGKARSKAEFFRLAGIGPALVEVITGLIEKPENFYSIPSKKRREIEKQMDAVLSSFNQ
jgi:hypothetical protein